MKITKNKIDPYGFILPAVILLAWYLVTSGSQVPQYLLPTPQKLLQVMADFVFGHSNLTSYSGTFIANLTASLLRVAYGFGLAALFGLTLGFLSGRNSLVKRIVDPTINLIRAMPGIGWLPLAMVWFGVGEKTTVFLISLAAFFPIFINTAHGASQVPFLLIRAGRMLGANKLKLFIHVILPSAFPSVLVGLRLGLGISWAYLVLGELTGVSLGLGAVMMDSRMLGQVEMVLAAMIGIAIIGKLTDILLMKLGSLILPYSKEDAK